MAFSAVAIFNLEKSDLATPGDIWIFWVEAALLALFFVFWALQTFWKWNEGVGKEDRQ
ncbi:MAG: hypothetical protein ABJA74_16475 [Lapillicoccus sp.]